MRASQTAEDADAVLVVRQHLEQVALAQPFLDAAPPVRSQDLTVRAQEDLP